MKKSLWGLVLERAIVVMAKIFLRINYIWRHLKDILNVCWKLASGLWRKEGVFQRSLDGWSGGVIYDTSCNQEVPRSSLSLSLFTDLRHCSASLHKTLRTTATLRRCSIIIFNTRNSSRVLQDAEHTTHEATHAMPWLSSTSFSSSKATSPTASTSTSSACFCSI